MIRQKNLGKTREIIGGWEQQQCRLLKLGNGTSLYLSAIFVKQIEHVEEATKMWCISVYNRNGIQKNLH